MERCWPWWVIRRQSSAARAGPSRSRRARPSDSTDRVQQGRGAEEHGDHERRRRTHEAEGLGQPKSLFGKAENHFTLNHVMKNTRISSSSGPTLANGPARSCPQPIHPQPHARYGAPSPGRSQRQCAAANAPPKSGRRQRQRESPRC